METFMNEDFLLSTKTAQKLYHQYAKSLPIVDYHCHLDAKEIYEDKRFQDITGLWLGGDHYKWRLMRANGIEEFYITGTASNRDKFQKWAETLELAVGNPLYHWSHLELKRYFQYDGVLKGETAQEVWDLSNEKLKDVSFTARNLIRRSGVEVICTTDDPVDSLQWHKLIAKDPEFQVIVLPTWRPDKAFTIEKEDYLGYLKTLSDASGVKIEDFPTLMEALKIRMNYFAEQGCVIADHGVSEIVYQPASRQEVADIFAKRLAGQPLSDLEREQFVTACFLEMGQEYNRRNWVMQLHYGVKRDNNQRIVRRLGPDAGVDCISNQTQSAQIADFLNGLQECDALPKMIVYPLNPVDNIALGTVIGCFQNEQAIGKIQQGSAWWFNDHIWGMEEQMKSVASQGLLGNFVGMLTDSRSFVSYVRHEYFRRILCNLLGEWVEQGKYPEDNAALEKIVKGICYDNAIRYFGFPHNQDKSM